LRSRDMSFEQAISKSMRSCLQSIPPDPADRSYYSRSCLELGTSAVASRYKLSLSPEVADAFCQLIPAWTRRMFVSISKLPRRVRRQS
jgi:hypothetical protein